MTFLAEWEPQASAWRAARAAQAAEYAEATRAWAARLDDGRLARILNDSESRALYFLGTQDEGPKSSLAVDIAILKAEVARRSGRVAHIKGVFS